MSLSLLSYIQGSREPTGGIQRSSRLTLSFYAFTRLIIQQTVLFEPTRHKIFIKMKKIYDLCRTSAMCAFCMFAVVLAGVCMTSCGDDDDESEKTSEKQTNPLIGTWTRSYQDHGRVNVEFCLKTDGTYTQKAWLDGDQTMNDYGVYSYNANAGVLSTASKAGSSPWTYFVMNVTDDVLVLMFSDYSGTITFTRK